MVEDMCSLAALKCSLNMLLPTKSLDLLYCMALCAHVKKKLNSQNKLFLNFKEELVFH